jgi:pSer/pThr/pTyr-binding forkhead associated (FHA) protein
MFALEIDFHDGVSSPEILLVRRPHVLVGSSDYAHVVIEGAGSGSVELRLLRGLGREFRCQPVERPGVTGSRPQFLEGVYQGDAQINLGEVTIHVTALDMDLRLHGEESPDQAGIRVARQALARPTPLFPAVAVLGSTPLFASFCDSEPLIIGRSRKCGLRLDASDISSEHARVGVDNGEFWIEDLGSTNGTFIGEDRISGRQLLSSDDVFRLGAEYRLAAVADSQDVASLKLHRDTGPEPSVLREMYPCVISQSELIRPSRFVIPSGSKVSLGRDPTNDIWVGAPHVSRRHLEIWLNDQGAIELMDSSSNGTFVDGERLPNHQPYELPRQCSGVDFNEGVMIHICYSQEDERDLSNLGDSAKRPVIRESIQLSELDDDRTRPFDLPGSSSMPGFFGAGTSLNDMPPAYQADSGIDSNEPEMDELRVQNQPAGVFDRLLEQQHETAMRLEGKSSAALVEDEFQDAPKPKSRMMVYLVVVVLILGAVAFVLHQQGFFSLVESPAGEVSNSERSADNTFSAVDSDIDVSGNSPAREVDYGE